MFRIRSAAALCVARRSNVRFCVVRPNITPDMRLDPSEEAKEGKKKVDVRLDDTRRNGAIVHKLSLRPQVYELDRVVKALRACEEPAYRTEPVSARFYCRRPELTKGKKRPDVKGAMEFPHNFGEKSKVGLFTQADSPLLEELKDEVDQVVIDTDFVSFFGKVHHETEELMDIYVATSKVESKLHRFGAILKEKTPSRSKGLIGDTADEMREVLQRACYTKRYVIGHDGVVDIPVGDLSLDVDSLRENIKKVAVTFRAGCNHEDGKFLDYVVLHHGFGAFCVDIQSLGILF